LSVRITIDHDIFDVRSEEERHALDYLFLRAARHRHAQAVIITNPVYVPGGDHGKLDEWLCSRHPQQEHAFRRVLTTSLIHARGPRNAVKSHPGDPPRFYLPGPLQIRVERRTESDWAARKLTLADATDLLEEPVHWVVENERTETRFVLHLADPTNRATLQECLAAPGRIVRTSGGSGEIRKRLESLIVGARTSDKWRRMLRSWVLFDSDAGEQDAREPSKNACDIMKLCKKVVTTYGEGLSWICLHRREIESYVPDCGLQNGTKTGSQKVFVDRVIAWRAREDRKEWAWALDLKKGLSGDLRPGWDVGLSEAAMKAIKTGTVPPQPQMLKAPFYGCSATELDEMKQGFGDKLGKLLRAEVDPVWAPEFATEYDRDPADQVSRSEFVQSLFDRM
jgi:hypothetical protein